MSRFLLGALVGVLVGAGATYVKLEGWPGGPDPLATASDASSADASEPRGKKGKKGRGKRPRRGNRGAGGGAGNGSAAGEEEEYIPEDIELTAADRMNVATGDALKPRSQTIDMSKGGAETRNLEQGEIDGTVRASSGDIIDCITDARGDAPLSGRVTVGLVVGPDGRVTQTRIEAPRYLVDQGLAGCLRPVLRGLRFPAVGKDTVVKVPFDIS